MEMRIFGKTGMEISRLGIGLAEIGYRLVIEEKDQASCVLNSALDLGINFLDTAACYGISEELIGYTVSHRRDEYILSTKCGHITGEQSGKEWTVQTVRENVEQSLIRMKTDHMDIVHLHSCSTDILKQGEVVDVLIRIKEEGKTRFIGYSGDNEAALWAVDSGLFDSLQTSFNLVDQKARYKLLKRAYEAGMGVIAKRPIANIVWNAQRCPSRYADEYYERANKMRNETPFPNGRLSDDPEDAVLLALGYVLSFPEIHTAIVGTANVDHLRKNIEMLNTLPLAEETVKDLNKLFDRMGQEWVQLT